MKHVLAILIASSALSWELGPTYSIPSESGLQQATGFQVRTGEEFYFWGSYTKHSLDLVGQSIGSTKLYGAGIGGEYKSVFWEFGRFWNDVSVVPHVKDEAVTYHLTNLFGRNRFLDAEYDLGNAWGGRIGYVSKWDKLDITVAYRFLRVDEDVDAWNIRELGHPDSNWWQTRSTQDIGAIEMGAMWRF